MHIYMYIYTDILITIYMYLVKSIIQIKLSALFNICFCLKTSLKYPSYVNLLCFSEFGGHLDAILNYSKRSSMPRWHTLDYQFGRSKLPKNTNTFCMYRKTCISLTSAGLK